MSMKKLKVASPQWAGYNGVLGNVMFVDGVSVDYLPRHHRDRLAAGMQFIEIDEDGDEQPAGSVHRLVTESKARLEPVAPLARQTEEEKKAELVQIALDAAAASPDFLTREDLEAIASKGGIKALREVSDKWGVKHRSIPVLIESVLIEQEKFIAKRNQRIAAAAVAELEAKGVAAPEQSADQAPESAVGIDDEIPTTQAEEQPQLPLDDGDAADRVAEAEDEALLAAAAAGNLGAALNSENEGA